MVTWLAPAPTGLPISYVVTASGLGAQTCGPTFVLTCTVTGLTNGVGYTFTVTATTDAGTSSPSGPSNLVTPAPTAPGRPTGATGLAGNASVTVSWTAPVDDGGSPITGYVVTSSPEGKTCSTVTTSCVVVGLTNGQAYSFTVVASNLIGPGPASGPTSLVVPVSSWSVSLSTVQTTVNTGTWVTLTAAANQNVQPTPYFIVILASDGSVVSSCGVGTTCTGHVYDGDPGSQTYTAVVGTSSGLSPLATSMVIKVTWATAPATFHALTPTRLLDTRTGVGLSGALTSNVARTFKVTGGTTGVPLGAVAVTGNLTVTQQTAPGYLFLGPIAQDNPTSSTLNFPLMDDRANGVTVAVGAGGTLSVTYGAAWPSGTTHAVFDVTGYFTPDTTGATYHAVTPTRLLDSRSGVGLSNPFDSQVARTFQVTGGASVVPDGAVAVTGNVTITDQSALGYVFVGPLPVNNPTSSTLNFPLMDDRANGLTVALGSGGSLSVTYVAASPFARADVIFDVTGYFTPDLTGAKFQAMAPTRILDTRDGTGLFGTFVSTVARTFQVTGTASGVPWAAVAVTGNLTVTQQSARGYLFVGPFPVTGPTATSTLNFPAGDDRANGLTVAIGPGGTLSLTLNTSPAGGTAQALFDVTGFYAP